MAWLALAAILAATIGLGAALAVGGTTYYVATDGSDLNAGTITSPWRTIGKGLTSLSAGDTLVVRGGTYAERIQSPPLRPGTSSSRITVRNYPGERPVIEGLLWLRSASYWTFDGINVTWGSTNTASEHMVKFTNGVGWTFVNGEIWGAHSFAGLLVTGSVANEPGNWRIADSCIHDTYPSNMTNQDHNVYLDTGVAAGSGIFERNIVFNAPNGRNVKLGPGGSTGGTVNSTIRNNTFYNAAQPISPSYASNHNRFEGNILGKSAAGFGLIYAYRLSGTDNVATGNLGFLATSLLSASLDSVPVVDGGGNRFPEEPLFDSTSTCSGFHPSNPEAQAYGRYAASTPPSDPVVTPLPTATPTPTPSAATPAPSPTPIAPTPTPTLAPTLPPTPTATTAPPPPTATPPPTPAPTAPPAAPVTTVLAARADADVVSSKPHANTGTASSLTVGEGGGVSHRSYLRYDVSGLTGTVASAKVRLRVVDPSSVGGRVYGTTTNWKETRISWATAPAPSGAPIAAAGPVSTGQWVEFNVASVVTGNGSFGFVVGDGGADSVIYSSREGADAPQLVIVTNP